MPSMVSLKGMNYLLRKMMTKAMRKVLKDQITRERGNGSDVHSPDVCLGCTTYDLP